MNAGRKRAFCRDQALDKAMHVFWQNGYSGTSMSQLTEALGINKPSLYAAFGNKEQLYASAMAHYMERYAVPALRALTDNAEQPFENRLKAYLLGIVDTVTDCESPGGCMFVKSSCESGAEGMPREVSGELAKMARATETAIIRVLEAEKLSGRLPDGTQVQQVADFIQSLAFGLTVLAMRGKSREELIGTVEFAVTAIPMIH